MVLGRMRTLTVWEMTYLKQTTFLLLNPRLETPNPKSRERELQPSATRFRKDPRKSKFGGPCAGQHDAPS